MNRLSREKVKVEATHYGQALIDGLLRALPWPKRRRLTGRAFEAPSGNLF